MLTFDFTLAGVPDLLPCIRLSLPDDDDVDGAWLLGDGLLDLNQTCKGDSYNRSFPSITLTGIFRSIFGKPTEANALLWEEKFEVSL